MIKLFIPIFAIVVLILACILLFRRNFGVKKSIIFLLVGGVLAYALSYVAGFLMLVFIGLSHVVAYSPDADKFEAVFIRDAQAYFSNIKGRPVTVTYEDLRDGPIQSGIGFPRYRIRVKVFADGCQIDEGEVIAAGVGKDRFEIMRFFSKSIPPDVPEHMEQDFTPSARENIKSRLRP